MTKLALITGTSRGLGQATAEQFLERGWTVWGVARGEAATALTDAPQYHHQRLDLTNLATAAEWLEGPFRESRPADVSRFALVNNAAVITPLAPMSRLSPEEWSSNLTLNLSICGWLMGFAAREFANTTLRVVNISSGAAHHPFASAGLYCAAKSALRMLDQVFAAEIDQVGECTVTDGAVLTYAPGVVETTMQEDLRGADPNLFPDRPRFQDLRDSGQLVHPSRPAAEIVEFAESNNAPRWSERRYGT